MKVGDWVIVEDCSNKFLVGKVSRVIIPNHNNIYFSFKTNAFVWDHDEGSFEYCLNLRKGWSAKVRPLTLLERELYEL